VINIDLTPDLSYTTVYGATMKRKITDTLVRWKNRTENRKPMILFGARQVGKTYILQQFGAEHYQQTLYLNFEQKLSYQSIFEGDLSPDRILKLLETLFETSIIPEKTLIILDEIQICERALTSLKYFCESAPDIHIVGAGSLLGVAVNRNKASFPVGKIEMHTLYPMDFEEFLFALHKDRLIMEIKESFNSNQALVKILHEQALDIYRSYLCTGGMPASILEYIQTGDFIKICEIQNNLINAYIADMSKYTTAAESVKVRMAFDSLPVQLAKENKKFQYKVMKKGASAAHFGSAINWLYSSGIALKCRRIDQGWMPPSAHVDISAFKLYMADTGLLMAKSGTPHQSILLSSIEVNAFKGAVVENYVAQSLASNGYDLFYWESKSQAEVDFVIIRDSGVIPVEVKSANNTRSRSLSVYISKYKPKYSIRLSTKNFGFENNIKSVPLYAAYLI